jgi:hypothetical protein
MKGVSSDLLFVLLFVLIFLGQYVVQRIRASKKQQQRSAPDELLPEPGEQAPAAQWQWEVPPAATDASLVMPVLTTAERRTERREAPAARGRRRFSRESLMGDRHKLQDAVVIAAIMGPCRAAEPHDIRQ